MIRRRCLIWIALSWVAGFFPSSSPGSVARANSPAPEGSRALTFVYIHGFGGRKEAPEFCRNLHEFFRDATVPAEVVNYEWDSVEVDPFRAGASWVRSQERADAEAARYRSEVLDRLEAEGDPYVLVGFSVGSRVILRALEDAEKELEGLRGVYFLGAALPRDETLKSRTALPRGMKITNYHSPVWDMVHRTAFSFMSEVPAGGQVGFDDDSVFVNFPVSCTQVEEDGKRSRLARGCNLHAILRETGLEPGRNDP